MKLAKDKTPYIPKPVYPSAEWLAWRKQEMGIKPDPKVREVVACPGPKLEPDGK